MSDPDSAWLGGLSLSFAWFTGFEIVNPLTNEVDVEASSAKDIAVHQYLDLIESAKTGLKFIPKPVLKRLRQTLQEGCEELHQTIERVNSREDLAEVYEERRDEVIGKLLRMVENFPSPEFAPTYVIVRAAETRALAEAFKFGGLPEQIHSAIQHVLESNKEASAIVEKLKSKSTESNRLLEQMRENHLIKAANDKGAAFVELRDGFGWTSLIWLACVVLTCGALGYYAMKVEIPEVAPNATLAGAVPGLLKVLIPFSVILIFLKLTISQFLRAFRLRAVYAHRVEVVSQIDKIVTVFGQGEQREEMKRILLTELARTIFTDPAIDSSSDHVEFAAVHPVMSVKEILGKV